jgi:Domain of unknown function (DUF4145)
VPHATQQACISTQNVPSLPNLLQATALFLWREWPRKMQLSTVDQGGFVLAGICPHCQRDAAFPSCTSVYEERGSNWPVRLVAGARCIACSQYILSILQREETHDGSGRVRWVYEAHYPMGKPNDTVSEEIPAAIRPDFQEALRCRWVNAYNATIEMCRRALESSCIDLGADADLVLAKMIDWVHVQGKITTPLKEMAHKIKLGGNRAAHPSDRTLTPDDADAVIEFTRDYFHHVYVMPARMEKYNFDKPDKKGP